MELERHRVGVISDQRDEARRVACEQYTRANKLERENAKLKVSRAHWRESFERVSIERDELSKQLENSDRWRGNISDAWVELKEQNDELVAALKDIENLPFYTTERVYKIIHAALAKVSPQKNSSEDE